MDKKKRNIIIGAVAIVVVFVVLSIVAWLSIFQGFSAEKYVDAVLEQMLEGDVDAAVSMTKGLTKDVAKGQYEATVTNFVNNVIASGLTLEDGQKEACVESCKKIFSGMEYDVKEEKKITDDEYQVTVTYRKSDVLTKLKALADAETARIYTKVEDGEEYRGTLDEINGQMQNEYATNLAAMLDEAYKTMEFGEEESFVLTVKKGESGLYTVDGAEIGEFLTKIMGLDENQD